MMWGSSTARNKQVGNNAADIREDEAARKNNAATSMNPFTRLTMMMTQRGGGQGKDNASMATTAAGETMRKKSNTHPLTIGSFIPTAQGGVGVRESEKSSLTSSNSTSADIGVMEDNSRSSHSKGGMNQQGQQQQQQQQQKTKSDKSIKDKQQKKKEQEEKSLLKQAFAEWGVDIESSDLVLDGMTSSKLQWRSLEAVLTKPSEGYSFTTLSMQQCLLADEDILILAPMLRASPFIKQVRRGADQILVWTRTDKRMHHH